MHDEHQIRVLHNLLAWLPYIEDDQQRIVIQLLHQLVIVVAAEIADFMGHFTPIAWAAGFSIDYYVSKYKLWRPEHASEILVRGLDLWLETLGRAGVDIHQYFSRQCELGATKPMECCVRSDHIDRFPEHSLDQSWYVELTFWENPDATEANNPRDFGIGVRYYPVPRSYPVPGAWSDETEKTDQSDQDDVQSRVEELGIEDNDDQDGDDQDGDDQDGDDQDGDDQDDDDQDDDDQGGQDSDRDAEGENCDESADPD
jgi:hypothetical protein